MRASDAGLTQQVGRALPDSTALAPRAGPPRPLSGARHGTNR